METLTIFDSDKNLVTLNIETSQSFPYDLGLWYVDSNTLFLGYKLKMEWDQIQGSRPKQQLFLAKLKKVSHKELGQ